MSVRRARSPRFGMQRLIRPDLGRLQRLAYRVLGVADPAHWLHFQYFRAALGRWPDFTPRTVLDAGCGNGDYAIYLAQRFPGAEVVGLDIDAENLERCRASAGKLRLANLRFELGDLSVPHYPAGSFDLIVTIDVLEHVRDPERALRQLAALLSPEGRFFFHVPTVREIPTPLSRHLAEFHAWAAKEHVTDDFTAESFEKLVRTAGLRPAKLQRTFGRWTGELATSLFLLPYRNTPINRVAQLLLILPCRLLAALDSVVPMRNRYAVALEGGR